MNSFDNIEKELCAIQCECIIKPIDEVIGVKTNDLDTYLEYAIGQATFSKHQHDELNRIEQAMKRNYLDNIEIKRLLSHNKKKLANQLDLLNNSLNMIQTVDNLFSKSIDDIGTKINQYAFAQASTVNHEVKLELSNYKKYLISRQNQYRNVSQKYQHARNALLSYYQSLKLN